MALPARDIIRTRDIEDLAVTTGKIANLAVTTGKIANLAVTTGKIDDGAVTTVKININADLTLNSFNLDDVGDINLETGSSIYWGTDLRLYRQAANTLGLNLGDSIRLEQGVLEFVQPSSSSQTVRTLVSGDSGPRWTITTNGTMWWGAGGGSFDVNLSRGAADQLWLADNDSLRILGDGQLIMDATGVPPFVVTATSTWVQYLDVDKLDGLHASDIVSGAAQNLQQVTTVGNETTNSIEMDGFANLLFLTENGNVGTGAGQAPANVYANYLQAGRSGKSGWVSTYTNSASNGLIINDLGAAAISFKISGDGHLKWGSAADVELYRSAAHTLALAAGDKLHVQDTMAIGASSPVALELLRIEPVNGDTSSILIDVSGSISLPHNFISIPDFTRSGSGEMNILHCGAITYGSNYQNFYFLRFDGFTGTGSGANTYGLYLGPSGNPYNAIYVDSSGGVTPYVRLEANTDIVDGAFTVVSDGYRGTPGAMGRNTSISLATSEADIAIGSLGTKLVGDVILASKKTGTLTTTSGGGIIQYSSVVVGGYETSAPSTTVGAWMYGLHIAAHGSSGTLAFDVDSNVSGVYSSRIHAIHVDPIRGETQCHVGGMWVDSLISTGAGDLIAYKCANFASTGSGGGIVGIQLGGTVYDVGNPNDPRYYGIQAQHASSGNVMGIQLIGPLSSVGGTCFGIDIGTVSGKTEGAYNHAAYGIRIGSVSTAGIGKTACGIEVGAVENTIASPGVAGPVLQSAKGYIHLMNGWLQMRDLDSIAEPQLDPNPSNESMIYMSGSKLCIKFKDGGTMKYFYLDLTQAVSASPGSLVNWRGQSTAP